jgi:hypothetical protein
MVYGASLGTTMLFLLAGMTLIWSVRRKRTQARGTQR